MPKLLIVDDELQLLETLKRLFVREGYEVEVASSGEQALEKLRASEPAVVLTDLIMPGMNGLELMRAARTIGIGSEFVLMTAYGTVETAVEAMKEGAYDFITKPYKKAQILRTVERAAERYSLVAENRKLKAEIELLQSSEDENPIIGESSIMLEKIEMLKQAATTSATVLLLGESGTGKELFARHLHKLSPRSNKPFVALNCAALPESILEAELFGYVKGAFTGATGLRKGRFEVANGGTLFLDEIADMSPALQAKLLRVIEHGSFERLGSSTTITVDVRIVAATNKNLKHLVEQGLFREDLYYRLNVIVIEIPPLRKRKEDIPLLVASFIKRYAKKHNKPVKGISPEALKALEEYDWPGNVRELEKAIERAVVLAKTDELTLTDFPDSVKQGRGVDKPFITIPFGMKMNDIERLVIAETLKRTKGDKRLAANILGISERTIYRKLEEERYKEKD